MKRLFCSVAVTVVTLLGLSQSVGAAGFDGKNMTLFFDDPTLGTHIDTRNFTVFSPREAESILGFMTLDVQARKLVLTTRLSGNTIASLPNSNFSGLTLFDSGNNLPTITGVSIRSSTDLPGFEASRLSFDADNIHANLRGLNFRPDTRLELDVTFDTVLINENFVGRNMTLFFDDPDLGAHIDAQTQNFTVRGVEAERILGFLDVDVAASQIVIANSLTGNTTANFPSSSFSGLNLFDSSHTVDTITGVSINPASNLAGFDASRLTFDADNVYTNLQGLTFQPDTRLILDVTFAPEVSAAAPEPSPFALIALIGSIGLAVRARKHMQERRGSAPTC